MKWSNTIKAFALAVGCCALMFLLCVVVKVLPISEGLQETLIGCILWPLSLITRSLGFLVDLVGPKGRAERASSYLSVWGLRLMATLSLVLLIAVFFVWRE